MVRTSNAPLVPDGPGPRAAGPPAPQWPLPGQPALSRASSRGAAIAGPLRAAVSTAGALPCQRRPLISRGGDPPPRPWARARARAYTHTHKLAPRSAQRSGPPPPRALRGPSTLGVPVGGSTRGGHLPGTIQLAKKPVQAQEAGSRLPSVGPGRCHWSQATARCTLPPAPGDSARNTPPLRSPCRCTLPRGARRNL